MGSIYRQSDCVLMNIENVSYDFTALSSFMQISDSASKFSDFSFFEP